MNNMNVDYVTLHYRSVLNDFSNQFLNEEFSDCVLNAEGRSLKVHKAMLCAQSSFLEKMILEHQNIGDLCFIIEGVSFDDLKSVVQFMYNGFAKLYKQNFGSFLVVAELLGVKWLDRVQILNDAELSQVVSNVSEPDQVIKPVNYETQPIPVFKDLTNRLDTKGIKRKKHMKNKKHCKRSKCTKEDHRNDRKKHKVNHTFRHGDNREKDSSKETHLADMDENTFCTALGLKKNELQSRENFKTDTVCKTDAKICSKNKTIPPLIKINREIKSTVENYQTRDSNMFVSEFNTVYIEDKNLSFLNIGANELCIRENNIEIECDVLDASTSQFVIDKEPVASIVELREENIIQAEFVDINPADEDSSSCSDCTTHESVTSVEGQLTETMGAISSSTNAPLSSTGGLRKSSRPCRKKTCSGFTESTATNATTAKKGGMTIDKTYLEGSTLFWCDVCQRTYHTKTGLNQHKRYECCKEPAFACPRCDKRFKRKSSLVRHAITLHDEAIFPTRTKLLSKLTGQGDKSILTIAERNLVKAEPNGIDTSAALTLQLNNSDWSISPSSSCLLTDDSILTPVSHNDVESNDKFDDAVTSVVATIDNEISSVVADISVDNATIKRRSLDRGIASIESPKVLESNRIVEKEFLGAEVNNILSAEERRLAVCERIADNGRTVAEENSALTDDYFVRTTSSSLEPVKGNIITAKKTSVSVLCLHLSEQDRILHEKAEDIAYQVGIANRSADIDLSQESAPASFEQSNHEDQNTISKPIEIISLVERDTELDCGVSESIRSVSFSLPPQQLVTPVEAMVDPILSDVPWINKKKQVVSKAIDEAVKHGSVIIRARGKILRKSSRKKIGPKKHNQSKDSFQEYLEKAFELSPFIIKIDRYKTGSEQNDSEKLNFLSNFDLKRNSVFPIYSEHAYAKYNCRSQRKPTLKTRRSNLSKKIKKKNKHSSAVICKRKQQSIDLSKLNISRTINAVEIERLEENVFTKVIDIQKEHSYNFQSFKGLSLRH